MSTDPVLDAIQAVREDVRTNHEMLTRRLDQMVTKDVHDAEVRRIDSELASQKISHSELKKQVTDGDSAILSRMDADQKANSAKEEAAKETAKADRRWLLGWAATLCTVVTGVATFLNKILFGG